MTIHSTTLLSRKYFSVRKSILGERQRRIMPVPLPWGDDDILIQRPLCDLLFGVFVHKINESIRLFHKSRLQEKYADYVRKLSGQPTESDAATHSVKDGEVSDASFEAVVLAICFSSVACTRDDQFFYSYGYSRETLWLSLKKATRAALLRAQYLEFPNMESLQALTLYLSSHYAEEPLDQSCWPLVGTLIRLAQSLGLHRDPLMFQIPLDIIDIELRRRLWYHICSLDQISAELHGPRPSIRIDDFDTLLPRNIDDDDLSFEVSTGVSRVPDGERFTEMTVVLIRMSTIRCVMRLDQLFREVVRDTGDGSRLKSGDNDDIAAARVTPQSEGSMRIPQIEDFIQMTERQHRQEYVQYSDGSGAAQTATRFFATVTSMKLWLFYYRLLSTRARQLKRNLSVHDRREYVLHTNNLLICDILTKEENADVFLRMAFSRLLSKAINLLELLETDFWSHALHGCYWLSSGIMQLHIVSQLLQETVPALFGLNELPDRILIDRCWQCIDHANFDVNGKTWAILRRLKEIANRRRHASQASANSSNLYHDIVMHQDITDDEICLSREIEQVLLDGSTEGFSLSNVQLQVSKAMSYRLKSMSVSEFLGTSQLMMQCPYCPDVPTLNFDPIVDLGWYYH
ncbi:Bikaverin cluster transcription factor bik5 [Trichoderma lentiforme]|uniref:Bikaverin cluster transcription factor bik5 n=1 Tax=Trichoderma lentiforme TaxID=1567552 RepID=A0A9P4X8G6_9HYPO|nr:Bikaverin cluster transcription factor bik5 [Trichoderma lentiforme]